MTIDIIECDEDKLRRMSRKQKVNLYQAQKKKNKLYDDYQKNIIKLRDNFMKQNMLHSSVYEQIKLELLRKYEEDVYVLRERLLYTLMRDMEGSLLDVPYLIDYGLTLAERYVIVKEYYEGAYEDPKKMFLAFAKDDFALSYLEDLYSTLYDYFYIASS